MKEGADNVVAVRVRNLGRNSRWYSGSGIFRHVHLTATPPLRVAQWGVTVTTPSVAHDGSKATVRVAVSVTNEGTDEAPPSTVAVDIAPPAAALRLGAGAASATVPVPKLAANSTTEVSAQVDLAKVALWSVDTPSLYTATVTLTSASGDTDTASVPFGVRTIAFSAKDGFLLNGVPTTLRGGCVHHDNGPLGSACIDRAEERRVELLKKNGYNAIRTSHNPVSPAFLDACDRLGVLVMDEAFDCWEHGKNSDDYHVYFDEWWERDLASMVKRDINHPSVIIWSIGNEIPMRRSAAGYALAHTLANRTRLLDPTRPVTSAVPGVADSDDPFFAALDVAGYNYSPNRYESDHTRFPDRVMVGTESFPKNSFQMWDQYTSHSWVLGDFIWTAIDYIGESAIGNAATEPDLQTTSGQPWNWHISWCGDIDIVGLNKPQAAYRTVLWDASPIEMLVHRPAAGGGVGKEHVSRWGWMDEQASWTWSGHEGEALQVRVFAKCASGSVTLTLDGAAVPGSPAQISRATEFTATFDVPYKAGALKAQCSGSADAAAATLTTAGAPAALRATADRAAIAASRGDLSYVVVEVVDKAGVRVPNARVRLSATVSGAAELAAFGTGDPNDVGSFHQPTRTTFEGRAVAVVRPKSGAAGKATLTVTAPGLPAATADITTHKGL